jgi:L-ribulose-5-phosphate 3-epimerase UlaE
VGYKIVGTPLGAGFLDIKSVIDLLKRSAHNPNIILEQWMNRLESEEETLQMEEDWVRRSVKHIKKSLGVRTGRIIL